VPAVIRHAIEWHELAAIEPTLDEVRHHVTTLAAAYNHPQNATLLGHTSELSEADVLEHYETLQAQGARPFLLLREGALAGDGDIRGIANGAAEFAFLIASPGAQGKGLGTRFATMIHAFAFERLGIERMYASVVPENTASRRVFAKLGYVEDTSDVAGEYGDDGDVVLAIARATFLSVHTSQLAEIRIAVR
jgi:RimJ/RimL family protein N-acetyltransferase